MASKRWVVGCAATVATVAMVLSPNPAKAEDSHLDRGTYLMNSIVACGACHTPKDPDGLPVAGQELAGGFVIDMPRFHSVTPNITPDPETGIGKWTDEQIINAIRNGKRPDGTTIGPPMPTQFYRSMSDNDVSAIVAYLRSVKPITHMVEISFQISLAGFLWPNGGSCGRCVETEQHGIWSLSRQYWTLP